MCGYNEHHGNQGCHCEQGHGGGNGDGCCREGNEHRRHREGCCGHEHDSVQHFHRRFVTKEERITWLEGYLKDIQTEAKAVDEHIAKMKKIA